MSGDNDSLEHECQTSFLLLSTTAKQSYKIIKTVIKQIPFIASETVPDWFGKKFKQKHRLSNCFCQNIWFYVNDFNSKKRRRGKKPSLGKWSFICESRPLAALDWVALGSVINSAQPQLNIFDIFPSPELTVTAERESNRLVTSSLSEDFWNVARSLSEHTDTIYGTHEFPTWISFQ